MECKLENITLHYEQFGEGRPLILLHGWPLDHRYMVKDFEPLFDGRSGWQRFYPDLPGMGKTPGPGWITNQDQMLDVLLAFIEAVIPQQHFTIAGASYGAYLAQGLIYHRADLIDGAMFVTPAMHVDPDHKTVPQHTTLVRDEALLAELNEDEGFFRDLAVVQSRQLLDNLRYDLAPAAEIADHDFLARVRQQFLFSFDAGTLAESFVKPALFLLGRQDSIVGYRDAWQAIEQYPRASFVVLDRAGHALGVEQKGLFRALTAEWLDRVEESLA